MPSIRFLSLTALCLLAAISCTRPVQTQQRRYQERFKTARQQFNALIQLLQADTITWKGDWPPFVSTTEFQQPIKNQLQQLGVSKVGRFAWPGCPREFDLTLDWDKHIPLHAYHNACDSINTRTDDYHKDENNNEIWGMGDHWALWTEVKLRDAKR